MSPIPNKEPTETWGVETSIPNLLAKITNSAVAKLADKPWLWLIVVILPHIVLSMLRKFIKPPIEIMKPTRAILLCKFMPDANQ